MLLSFSKQLGLGIMLHSYPHSSPVESIVLLHWSPSMVLIDGVEDFFSLKGGIQMLIFQVTHVLTILFMCIQFYSYIKSCIHKFLYNVKYILVQVEDLTCTQSRIRLGPILMG